MRLSCGANRPFPGQPVDIAWEDPITSKLVSAFAFNEHVGAPRDLVKNKLTTVTGTPSYGGRGMTFAATQYVETSAPLSTVVDNFTMSGWCRPTASGVYQYFFGNGTVNGVALGLDTGNGWNVFLPGVVFMDMTGDSFTSGKWVHFVAVRLNGTMYAYLDGINYALSSNTSNPATPTGHALIGNARSADIQWTGDVDNCLFWERALSPLEVRRLFLEPWCWASNDIPLWNAPDAATGPVIPVFMARARQMVA